jgi:hypothetical protein
MHSRLAIDIALQADRAFSATPKADPSTLSFALRDDAGHTTPIAHPARGSVQSGFNEVALGALGIVVSCDLTEASRFDPNESRSRCRPFVATVALAAPHS